MTPVTIPSRREKFDAYLNGFRKNHDGFSGYHDFDLITLYHAGRQMRRDLVIVALVWLIGLAVILAASIGSIRTPLPHPVPTPSWTPIQLPLPPAVDL